MYTPTYHRIVITCGISLFAQRNIYGKWVREQNLFDFTLSNPQPIRERSLDETVIAWKKACFIANLDLTIDQHSSVSAEFSLLHALREKNRLGNKPNVALITTDTLGGQAAVVLLEKLLSRHFNAEVKSYKVSDFDVNAPHELRRSLGSFMQKVAHALEGWDVRTTCFAPVGGYKVMTSLGYLAGAYMGFPTAYLHEDNQVLHEVPAVPIRISPDDLRPLDVLLRRAMRGILQWSELDPEQQQEIDRYPYLFEQVDDLVQANAFALFLADRPEFAPLLKTRVQAKPEVSPLFSGGNRDFMSGQVRELIKKLEDPLAHQGELHHEATFDSLKGKTLTCALYKGASNGVLVFRAAYAYDSDRDVLSLNQIWSKHDAYERSAKAGHSLCDDLNRTDWQDISELVWNIL